VVVVVVVEGGGTEVTTGGATVPLGPAAPVEAGCAPGGGGGVPGLEALPPRGDRGRLLRTEDEEEGESAGPEVTTQPPNTNVQTATAVTQVDVFNILISFYFYPAK
jgi:hypothetical protein